MREAQRIKKHYCRPAMFIPEHEWNQIRDGKLPSHYHLERYVWVDQALPEWRVAVAENIVGTWQADEQYWRNELGGGIQTRMVTYVPTGRIVYDNTLPPARAVVFEYELEHYRRPSRGLDPA